MQALVEYIQSHTVRGACQCGKCIDQVTNPELHQPTAPHTANLVFFKVALKNDPKREELLPLLETLKQSDYPVNLMDGVEHGYMEIGAAIGDQGLAMTLMGMGSLMGLWSLLTPEVILGKLLAAMPPGTEMNMAGAGYITIINNK